MPRLSLKPEQKNEVAALRSVRKELKLTQAQLAELFGVTRNTVARWERGEIRMNPAQRARLNDLWQHTQPYPAKRKSASQLRYPTPGRLRFIRERLKFTCEQMGEILGINPTTWSRWEKGQREVPSLRIDDVHRLWERCINETDSEWERQRLRSQLIRPTATKTRAAPNAEEVQLKLSYDEFERILDAVYAVHDYALASTLSIRGRQSVLDRWTGFTESAASS